MLHTLLILTLVFGTIRPLLDSESMLLILEPLALISTSVEVSVHAISISLILSPLSLVDISFSVDESAIAIGHTVSPEAVVSGSVWPNLNSAAIFLILVHEPFTLVDSSIFEDTDGFDLPLLAIINILNSPIEGLELLNYILLA